jgi:hypothetical protein
MGQYPNITRLEGVKAWQVRKQARGVKVSRYFRDDAHGGTEGSLQEAIRWRDEMAASMTPIESSASPRDTLTPITAIQARGELNRFIRAGGELVLFLGNAVRGFLGFRVLPEADLSEEDSLELGLPTDDVEGPLSPKVDRANPRKVPRKP